MMFIKNYQKKLAMHFIEKFKCRCSHLGIIMSGRTGLTEKQEETLAFLLEKPKITEKQGIELKRLQELKLSNELPEGVKSYCQDYVKSEIYGKKSEFYSKYADKGNLVENDSIDFYNPMLSKNTEYKENDYIKGTPDIVLDDCIIDIKSSWNTITFPLFEKEIPNAHYYWQLQGYMWLFNKKKPELAYILSNTPEHLLSESDLENGVGNYDNVPNSFRTRVFYLDYDISSIEKMKERIKLCRIYIKKLCDFVSVTYLD